MNITTLISLIFATIFIYFLMGLICNSVFEAISAAFSLRSKYLTAWIKSTFPGMYSHLLNHTLLDGLSSKGESASYITSSNFTTVLLELISRYWKGKVPANLEDIKKAFTDFNQNAEFRDGKYIIPKDFQSVILVFISEAQAFSNEEADQMKHFRTSIENWFDSMMDRVGGIYKRKSMLSTFIVAALITVSLNVDSVQIIQYLAKNPSSLENVVAEAESAVQNKDYQRKIAGIENNNNSTSTTITQTDSSSGVKKIITTIQTNITDATNIKNQMDDLFPLGWNMQKKEINSFSLWLSKIFGLLITIFAVSLGAPFWYDLLCKVANIRNSIKPLTAKEINKRV